MEMTYKGNCEGLFKACLHTLIRGIFAASIFCKKIWCSNDFLTANWMTTPRRLDAYESEISNQLHMRCKSRQN